MEFVCERAKGLARYLCSSFFAKSDTISRMDEANYYYFKIN